MHPAWQKSVFKVLKQGNVRQIAYVPDAGHSYAIQRAEADPEIHATVCTTEEEGVAIVSGAWLGGQRAALLMQSSGVGNCVDDLIDGFIRLMDSPADVVGPINLGNPGEFTILDLAKTVIELTGSRSKVVHRPLPEDDPRQRRPDITMAQAHLGWTPQVSLHEGLRRTIPYFEQLLATLPDGLLVQGG